MTGISVKTKHENSAERAHNGILRANTVSIPVERLTTGIFKGGHYAHPMKEDPMKEDVKGKSFSPPLWEMRVW
jgi:hypothetical protein